MRLTCQIVAEQWTHVVAELMEIVQILTEGFQPCCFYAGGEWMREGGPRRVCDEVGGGGYPPPAWEQP